MASNEDILREADYYLENDVTIEEALSAARAMIDRRLTYEQASQELGIPSSTLHEMVHKGTLDLETSSLLYALSEANRRGISLEEYQRVHSSEHIASDIVAREIREIPGKRSK